MKLRKQQFDNSVRIVAKSVVNQFLDKKNDSIFREHLQLLLCRKIRLEISDFVQVEILDSLLYEEFKCMNLSNEYYYGVYNRNSGRFISGNYFPFEKEIVNSTYQFSLSSIYRPGNYYLGIYFPNKTSIIVRNIWAMLVVSILFMIILITTFYMVIFGILKQKKISEIKTDFINNLTHEFKTPMATTSLAAEMLIRDDVSHDASKVVKYGNVVLYESLRLQSQVEQILQVASLEKGSFNFSVVKTDLHELLNNVVESFELRISKSNVLLTTQLTAENFIINTDNVHITNVFYNLIDNAIKYSFKKPRINIKTWNTKREIIIRFSDKGIGISKEFQKEVFKNLFRIPTGNLHDVRGFGLGLYYSKSVVEELGGHIKLSSISGKGSRFEVHLPLSLKNE